MFLLNGYSKNGARAIALMLVTSFSVTCSVKHIRIYDGEALAQDQVATLYNTGTYINVTSIDGRELDISGFGGFEYELPPGRHEIGADFEVSNRFVAGSLTCKLVLYAQANKKYFVISGPLGGDSRTFTIYIFESGRNGSPPVSVCSR